MTSGAGASGAPGGGAFEHVLESEFSKVVLSIDHEGNSPRLKIVVPETAQVGFLDPLTLERLAGLGQDDLALLFRTGAYAPSQDLRDHDG